MDRQEIVKVLYKSFETVLEHTNYELTDETTAQDVDGWESITHMMIIAEIEKELDIKFKLMDLMNMNNIGDLINVISSELQSKKV